MTREIIIGASAAAHYLRALTAPANPNPGKEPTSGKEPSLGKEPKSEPSQPCSASIAESAVPTIPAIVFLAPDPDEGPDPEAAVAAVRAATPAIVVFISDWSVYGREGENLTESAPLNHTTDAGRRFARTESLLQQLAREQGFTLTILRPGLVFGNHQAASLTRLFNRVIRGHYVHCRGVEAKISAITALDLADVARRMAGIPGIYNVTDGREYTRLELAQAMTANTGAEKRITALPEKWIRWIRRIFGGVPIVAETMSESVQAAQASTLTLDTTALTQTLTQTQLSNQNRQSNQTQPSETTPGEPFHPTLEVIGRRDPTYPYSS